MTFLADYRFVVALSSVFCTGSERTPHAFRNFDETDYPRGSIKRIMMEDFMVSALIYLTWQSTGLSMDALQC